MKKEKLIIALLLIGVILTIIVLIYMSYIRFDTKSIQTQQPSFVSPTSIPLPTRILPKITISEIQVNDFFKQAQKTNISGDVAFGENEKYRIVYLKKFNQFLINILSSPFPRIRMEAENAFIETLGITKDQACMLNVSVGTPYSVNPEYSGIKYSLSFCKDKK